MEVTHIQSVEEAVYYDTPSFNSWQDILSAYKRYISGETDNCPTHAGPLDEETIPFVKQLLDINKYHVVTVDSQPGLESGDCKQRAYLECYMYGTVAKKFKKKLFNSDLIINVCRVTLIGKKYSKDRSLDNLIPVTRVKDSGKWQTFTVVPFMGTDPNGMPLILRNTKLEVAENIIKDLYCVKIVDPVWGRGTYLFDRVVKALSSDPSRSSR